MALALNQEIIADFTIHGRVLPTSSKHGTLELMHHLETLRPDIVIALGLAADAKKVRLERVALNFDDFLIADNNGDRITETPIVEGASNAYFSNLPLKLMQKELEKKGTPTEISLSAGSFVCNHIYYHLLHALHQKNKEALAGFIHIPALPQANRESAFLKLKEAMISALSLTVDYAL